MPRNGNGVYNLPATTWNPAVTGTTIESSGWNTTASDLAAALTQSLSSDGQTVLAGNLQMGNNKLTGLGNGSASTDSITYGQAAKLSGGNTFTGTQTFSDAVVMSGSVSISGPIIFTGTAGFDTLGVSSVASIKNLIVPGTASIASLNAVGLSINSVSFPYEKGTFTPALNFGGSATGIVQATSQGTYTRLGDIVRVRVRIILSNKGSATGAATITGLPITVVNTVPVSAFWVSMTGLAGAAGCLASSGTTVLSLFQSSLATGYAAVDNTVFTNTSDININGVYQVT